MNHLNPDPMTKSCKSPNQQTRRGKASASGRGPGDQTSSSIQGIGESQKEQNITSITCWISGSPLEHSELLYYSAQETLHNCERVKVEITNPMESLISV